MKAAVSRSTDLLERLKQALITGDIAGIRILTKRALDRGKGPLEVIEGGLVPGMEVVGEKFRCNEYYIPNVLIAAQAMKAAMDLLKPLLAGHRRLFRGVAVIGSVQGDIHDIGKNLVAMMMEGGGFRVVDLGTDVHPEHFMRAVRDEGADLLMMSALISTTMMGMRDVIDSLKAAKLAGRVKAMVGGAPVTAKFAEEIGADGYAPDAVKAVAVARRLVGGRKKAGGGEQWNLTRRGRARGSVRPRKG
ncbi:MAG: corrinoid protein [Nitrospinota bacterium]